MTPPSSRRAAPLLLSVSFSAALCVALPAVLSPAVAQTTIPAIPSLPPKGNPVPPVTPPVPVVPAPTPPVAPVVTPPAPQAPTVPPVVPPQPVQPVAVVGSGVRGLWVDGFGPGLKTRAQVAQTVDDAVRMGVNTLFVHAIRRGDCLCLKAGIPVVTDKDLEKNFDPLEIVTRQAKARGLRVIAWVSVTGMYNSAAPNSNPQHIFRTHGPGSGAQSWLARRPNGSWLESGRDGWLDVGIPAAADYMTQATVNLVRNYAVDGVQLDRIRYPDGDVWGYDPKVLARYRAETGKVGTPGITDPDWAEWKRQQVTNLVRRIALEVKGVRSSAWVTAATITYLTPPSVDDPTSFRATRTYSDVLQDWPTWMHEGLIDLNVLMNYKRDTVPDNAAWFDGWNAFARSVAGRADGLQAGVAAGTAMYLNAPGVTAAQANRSVKAGVGWVGYSYRTPTLSVFGEKESAVRGRELVRSLLTIPGAALSNPAPWTEAPPTMRGLLGRVSGTPTPGYRVVEALQGGQVVAQTLTDGLGYYGFATLSAGKVEVRVSGQRWEDIVPLRGVVRLPDLFVRDLRPASAPSAAPAVPTVKPATPAKP